MDWYQTVKVVHIISSTILFGTGLGIAFFMLRSHFSTNLDEKTFAIHNTVLAEYLFTLPAVVLQPLTGVWLVSAAGYQSCGLPVEKDVKRQFTVKVADVLAALTLWYRREAMAAL